MSTLLQDPRLVRVQPVIGRGFQDGEDRPGADPVVDIGHEMWQNRFGGDPPAVGMLASFVPVRRATRVDAMVALRYE